MIEVYVEHQGFGGWSPCAIHDGHEAGFASEQDAVDYLIGENGHSFGFLKDDVHRLRIVETRPVETFKELRYVATPTFVAV